MREDFKEGRRLWKYTQGMRPLCYESETRAAFLVRVLSHFGEHKCAFVCIDLFYEFIDTADIATSLPRCFASTW